MLSLLNISRFTFHLSRRFSAAHHDRSEFASIHVMKYQVVSIEDVRWLLGHTGGFRGGYVTDVQVSKLDCKYERR